MYYISLCGTYALGRSIFRSLHNSQFSALLTHKRRELNTIIMATIRKLQAEIDKTFRKVDEQQEVFQQIFDRLKECDSSLKEKYEVLLFTDCIFHFVPPRNLYNCKIVSLIAFLFTRFKEEKREKKDSFQERERFFTESVLSFSLFARSMREERKGY